MSTREDWEWVASPGSLDALVARLRGEPVYAIDTEFQGERSYFPKLALIQIAWSDGLALIDPLEVDVMPLGEILSGPGIAVLHACSQDLPILERACGARPTSLFDPQVAGAFLGFGRASLGNLAREVLGVEITKGSQLANWLRRPLAPKELSYAASDVRYLLELREALIERLQARGRENWLQAECERELDRHRFVYRPQRAWWKIKGKGKLRGRARGVAQALAAWREEEARDKDRLTKHILSDMAIMGMAQRPPKSAKHIRGLRGIRSEQLSDRMVSTLLDVVEDGLSLEHDALEIPPKPPNEGNLKAALSLAMSWLAQVAADEGVDQTLLGTRDEIVRMLRGESDCALASGWRYDLAGATLKRLVDGECALGCRPDGGLSLWERP